MKGVVWEDEALGANYKDIDIPADMMDQAKEYHDKMIEAVCELDDDAATAYLEGKMPDEATVKKLLRKAVITGAFFPVLCGSAFKNKGVQPLLDAVVDYLPSPLDVPPNSTASTRIMAKTSCASPATTSRWLCLASRSWTTPLSAPSPSAASIPGR